MNKRYSYIYISIIVLLIVINTVLIVFSKTIFKNTEISSTLNIKRLEKDINTNWGLSAIGVDKLDGCDVKIAQIDSGVNLHVSNIKQGFNAIDLSNDIGDELGHGTSIASVLLEINDKSSIIPIKIFNNNSEYVSSEILKKAIDYAIKQEVDIINMSLGTKEYNQDVQNLINLANSKGIFVVASAGNYSGSELLYPARYENVISVIARDIDNVDDPNTNKSTSKKSFSAPGIHIVIKNGTVVSGSSIATAFVSGTIGILKKTKKNVENKKIIDSLIKTSSDSSETSYGLINAYKAYKELN